MKKPIILAVDDDPQVAASVSRDLKKKFADSYRIISATGAAEALDVSQRLAERGDVVALFLSDQRMPEMNGIAFLGEALKIFPDAKRVLLTAYADTSAAIGAINDARIHYYLLKPYDPPEEKLYPILEELLLDWQSSYRPPFEGIVVVGDQWNAVCFAVKDFLARNQVPYHWVDVENGVDAKPYLDREAAKGEYHLPLVVLPDGTVLQNPDLNGLAEKIGLHTKAHNPFYDVIIIGAGPAGLATAVYAGSEGLSTVLIEKEAPGGQAGTSSFIENYLGFPAGISGAELSNRAVIQAKKFNTEILAPATVTAVKLNNPYKTVVMADGSELSCHALILSMGVAYTRLELPGIDQYSGAGVYYGSAVSEAANHKDEEVFIVGGGNSAGQAAVYTARHARKVNILIRSQSLAATMSQYLISRIESTPNIEVMSCCEVTGVSGEGRLDCVEITNKTTGEVSRHNSHTLMVFIGAKPYTKWLEGLVQMDQYGFILTGKNVVADPAHGWTLTRQPYLLETSVPGIFAVGDVRSTSVKRVASAVGEGSITVSFVHQYLANL